ncbi:MAG: DEAD/DEAH box helicase family protein, partial [Chitinophagaceae bacterium]|nr:DEAD/DEAH box helicase family protein [Chitinophagaceae bacterium]
GKSVVIALTAKELEGNTLVLQPSKEILAQNFQKYTSYGFRAGIYSASAGVKFVDKVTFAMIGSIIAKKHLFKEFRNIIVDECHLVNAEKGMYKEFFDTLGESKVLGLTATPYRLSTGFEGAMLKFITRTRPKVFNKCLYYVQNDVLFNAGHLAPLEYYHFNVINRSMLETNSTGTDFTDASLKNYFRAINMPAITLSYAKRLLVKRKNLLIFCSLIEEAKVVAAGIPGAALLTGETPSAERDRILTQFKKGSISCLVNVGVLTTGFDYPALECVLIARSTMSLALYYQIVGRVMRPYTYSDGTKKVGWVVDLGGNIAFFGKIETMKIVEDENGLMSVMNNGRHLTNVAFTKQ